MIKLINKKNGVYYTGDTLARFIARRILQYNNNKSLNILDPACGESDLLIAIMSYLNNNKENIHFTGIDIDINSVNYSKKLFSEVLDPNQFNFHKGDFLQIYRDFHKGDLFSENFYGSISRPDIIIANPPYVRTQNMDKSMSKLLASELNITGKIDLYQAFIVAMIGLLKEDGLIGFIVSNKFLYTKSGASTREFLFKNLDILEIIDLGDTKPFDASILPVIIIGRKRKSENNKVKFQKVYEVKYNPQEGASRDNIYDVLDSYSNLYLTKNNYVYKITSGVTSLPSDSSVLWSLSDDNEKAFIEKIHGFSSLLLEDIANVKVGIKSTADNVFISKKGSDELDVKIESELVHPLISSENCNKWYMTGNKSLRKIIYPYTNENKVIDIKNFPEFQRYISNYKERLSNRSYLIESGKRWYELWVPQNFKEMAKEKIVFKDISEHSCFMLDKNSNLVNGNCFWITLKEGVEKDLIYLILAITNSDLMEKYHSIQFNNKLYSGKLRFNSQYVKRYPLPDLENKLCQTIISQVKKLVDNSGKNIYLEKELISKINRNVNILYGFYD